MLQIALDSSVPQNIRPDTEELIHCVLAEFRPICDTSDMWKTDPTS